MPDTKKRLDEIGSLIARYREAQGITQSELGKRIGTTQSAVARMENGEQNLSAEMLAKIESALKRDLITVSQGSMNFEVDGPTKLSGSVTVNTSKNGAVTLLCAALLNRGTTVLKSVPRIEEVHRIIEVLVSIGVTVTWNDDDVKVMPPKKLNLEQLSVESAKRTRSIIMMITPFAGYEKVFSVPQSGGCVLGSRSVAPHFAALNEFGIKCNFKEGAVHVNAETISGTEMILEERGDTVTANAIMAAAQSPRQSVIKYASANYQVQELCHFLLGLGVKIDGIGTTTLTVTGAAEIHADIEYELSEDPTDAMFFLAAAAVTGSAIEIKCAPIDFLELELAVLKRMGMKYKMSKKYLGRNGKVALVDIKTMPSWLKAPEEKVHALPYPGLNIDNLPFFAVIATQAEGKTLIHDWVYEARAQYYTDLDFLGADTTLLDQHRIVIQGKTPLHSADMSCPPALRPATIILIGMLAARGRSTLRNVYSINRGYEGLVRRLSKLGASIRLVSGLT